MSVIAAGIRWQVRAVTDTTALPQRRATVTRPNHRPLVAIETLGPHARLIELGATLDPAVAGEVTE